MALSLDARVLHSAVTSLASQSYPFTAAVALGEIVLVPFSFITRTPPAINSVTDDSAAPNNWSVIVPTVSHASSNISMALILGIINNTALTTSNNLKITLASAASTFATGDSFHGFVGTPTVDKTSTGTNTGTAASVTSVTTTVANEIVFAGVATASSSSTFTVGSGYTFTGVAQGFDSSQTGRAEYEILSATGAVTGPMTISSAIGWVETLATIYDLVAGGPSDHSLTSLGIGH